MVLALKALNVLAPCLGLLLIVLSSTPAAVHLARRLVRRRSPGQQDELFSSSPLYYDDDGEATPASAHKFSNQWQRLCIGFLSIGGLGVSLASATLSMRYSGVDDFSIHAWIHLGMWVSS